MLNPFNECLVIFTDSQRLTLMGLKKGCRHVLVAYPTLLGVAVLEAVQGRIVITEHAGESIASTQKLAVREGLSTLRYAREPLPYVYTPTPFTVSFFSCVEVTKRYLGIKAWWVITPYQLHKYITKRKREVDAV